MQEMQTPVIPKLAVTTTYLEMPAPPPPPFPIPARSELSVIRAVKPTVSFYRYLYNTVGKDWLWGDRRKLGDDELLTIIGDDREEINVVYYNGVPAGYVELDCRNFPEIEIAYFGIMPEFIGLGLGTYLLRWALNAAWSKNPKRVWLHTCNFDHPRALGLYQSVGFRIYNTEEGIMDDPRALGLF